MPGWQDFLAARGATFDGDRMSGFGSPEAGADAPLLVPLTHLAPIRFSGADALAFLQGQLTCDVKGRAPDTASLGAYCTPKGRMLATFIAMRGHDAVELVAARDIAAAFARRLRMFVLRSKVVVEDQAETAVLLGLVGTSATVIAAAALGADLPADPWRLTHPAAATAVLRLPGDRLMVLAPPDAAERLWDALVAGGMQPAPTAAWERIDIALGIPWVVGATQEQFVPQMANLELIGGVSFDKGCYPGQEIVARTHYRGEVKRRLRLAHVAAETPPAPGDELYVGGTADQTCGMVVSAVAAPGGGYDLLAVVQNAALEGEPVRLRSGDGPKLAFRALPYAVP